MAGPARIAGSAAVTERPTPKRLLGIVDPADNYVYEVHQYLDSNFSGTHPECRNETVRGHRAQGFYRLAAPASQARLPSASSAPARTRLVSPRSIAMLKLMDDNREVWIGWSYWAAGAWPPSYFTSVQPVNGADRPADGGVVESSCPRRSKTRIDGCKPMTAVGMQPAAACSFADVVLVTAADRRRAWRDAVQFYSVLCDTNAGGVGTSAVNRLRNRNYCGCSILHLSDAHLSDVHRHRQWAVIFDRAVGCAFPVRKRRRC